MEKNSSIRSIGRSLDVLRAINRVGTMSLAQIAKTCNLPYPTVSRIVTTLMQEGMLEREATRKHYRPTALTLALSHGYQDHSGITEVSRPMLEEFTHRHYWPVSLTTRVGQQMIVRDCTHGMSPMTLNNYQPGATFPIFECASGHVYLGFVSESERQMIVASARNADVPPDPIMLSLFENDHLSAKIRAAGFAARGQNQFTNTPGRTSSIAVPIFYDGRICGALTVVFIARAMKPHEAAERYLPDLLMLADRVGKAMAERNTAECGRVDPIRRTHQSVTWSAFTSV